MNSQTRRLSIALLMILCGGGLFAAEPGETWHSTGGALVDGRLSEVFGSLVLITGRKTASFVPIEALTDAELVRVAKFLSDKSAAGSDWETSASKVTSALRNQMDVLQNDSLEDYSPGKRREPDIFLIYFSAGWCPPCHRFTPVLIKAYQRLQHSAPGAFEVIFVSNDRSRGEQLQYAREAGMPWPVLKYSSLGSVPVIERWAGDGIPCLVAVTRNGDVIFHSYRGAEYLGPDQVLDSCDHLVPMLKKDSFAVRLARHRLAVQQYIMAAGQHSLPPKPYVLALDPGRYAALPQTKVTLSLEIDPHGNVTDARVLEAIPHELQSVLTEDASRWLFLPAVAHGAAQAKTVNVPLVLTAVQLRA